MVDEIRYKTIYLDRVDRINSLDYYRKIQCIIRLRSNLFIKLIIKSRYFLPIKRIRDLVVEFEIRSFLGFN